MVLWNCRTNGALLACLMILQSAVSLNMPRKEQFQMVQLAMALTKQSASNITAAYKAAALWNAALPPLPDDDTTQSPPIPDKIRAVSYALQAACLVRIGKDDCAIAAYDQALNLAKHLDAETIRDVQMGKGKSLQRLLRYKDAREQFRGVGTASGVVAAATCDMRLGDLDTACQTLEQYKVFDFETNKMITKNKSDMDACSEAKLMLETLHYLKSGQQSKMRNSPQKASIKRLSSNLPAAQFAGTSISPIYKWVHTKSGGGGEAMKWQHRTPFLDYCKANNGAFDDFLLVHLDDKVYLHKLLSTSDDSSQFWPQGMLLEADDQLLLNDECRSDDDCTTWICKRRAGYGSHGNLIVRCSLEHAKAMADKRDACANNIILLQQMVEPPLLLKGRKFSLRVYVVMFAATSPSSLPDVYISKKGLVKVAAVPLGDYDDDVSEEASLRMHMTNSGRETNMQQESFRYIRDELKPLSFEKIWSSVKTAVTSVINMYETRVGEIIADGTLSTTIAESRYTLAGLGTPKILGFDFVVDAFLNPWLVEVNRFPGLEPRNNMDSTIKHHIVYDAWVLAANRCNDKRMRTECLSWITADFAGVSFSNDKNSDLDKV